ncbi:MAG: hypothetical protein KGI54_18245, partial [Pseudomonadota bacterium]|nr:hypothetical protein [Pseudomonadota bacterium]
MMTTTKDGLPGSPERLSGRCGAKLTKRSKEVGHDRFCTRTEGYGTDHLGIGQCKYHGGSTPNAQKHAVRQIVSQEIAAQKRAIGDDSPPLDDPEIEYLKMGARIKSWSLLMEDMVHRLRSFDVTDQKGTETIKALVSQLGEERDRYLHVLEFMQKQDLRKRAVALEEEQARRIAEVVLGVVL